MSLSIINVPSLHNGVSQQSPTVRSPDQGEEQDNAWASLADGLLKRPPLEHVAKVLPEPVENAHLHEINRDVGERYTVVASEGVLRVFTLDGVEVPVSAPAGWSYLEGIEDFTADITMTTVADYTFVVNRKAVPAMKTPTAPPPGWTPPPGSDGTYYPPTPGEDTFVPPRGSGRTNQQLSEEP